MKTNTKKLTVTALLVAAALILSYVESMLPSFSVPGVKLGLANVASVFALYTLGGTGAVFVSLVRVVVSGLLFGSAASFIYSAAGAVLSLCAMILLKKTGIFSVLGVSVIGGVAHNIGQLAAASAVMHTVGVMYYLPVLLLSGAVTGALIGIAGGVLVGRIGRLIPDFS